MTDFDAAIPDGLLKALDVAFGPDRTVHLPEDIVARFPDGLLDETLVLASIRWPKYVGRPTTRHLYEAFDIQMYRKDKVYGVEGGVEVHWDVNTPIADWKVRDSNAQNDSHYAVYIVAHTMTAGNTDAKGGNHPYIAEVTLRRGVPWTLPSTLFTQGRYRVVSPRQRWFSFPGPVRLDPFTVQMVAPELRIP